VTYERLQQILEGAGVSIQMSGAENRQRAEPAPTFPPPTREVAYSDTRTDDGAQLPPIRDGSGYFDYPFGAGSGTGTPDSQSSGRSTEVRAERAFENVYPGLYAAEVDAAARADVRIFRAASLEFDRATAVELIWVITETDDLLFASKVVRAPDGTTFEPAHSHLSGGRPVYSAGTAVITRNDRGTWRAAITNHSGHFEPDLQSLYYAAAVFRSNGILVDIDLNRSF
jgi:hypothetical protein